MQLNPALVDRLQRALQSVGSRVLLLTDDFASFSKIGGAPVAVPGMKPAARLATNVWGYGAGSTLSVHGSDYTVHDLPLRDRAFDVLFDFALPGLSAHLTYRVEWPSKSPMAVALARFTHVLDNGETYKLHSRMHVTPELPISYACGAASGKMLEIPLVKWSIEKDSRKVRLIDVLGRSSELVVEKFTPRLYHDGKKFEINPLVEGLTYYQVR